MTMVLNRSLEGDERLPLYQRLADSISTAISEGLYKPGNRLPSENVIAEQYGMAAGTVRQALSTLVDRGILERFHGKGTFVRQPNFDQSLFRFFRIYGADGERVKPVGRILTREVAPCREPICHKLQLEHGSDAIQMSRLRSVDDQPVLIEDIWLPLEPFQAFLNKPIEEVGDLLYPVYASVSKQTVMRVEEMLTVEVADEKEAKILGIEISEPIVVIDRLAFGYEDKPLEWRRSKGKASEFQYHVEIR